MIRSRLLRALVIRALAGGVLLILAGWSTDSPRDRFIDASISLVALFLVIGIALPVRGAWALRIVAGAIGASYLWYFASQLWWLLAGEQQSFRLAEPSVWMAALGLLIIGLPMLLFALGGAGLALLRPFMRHGPGGPSDDSGGKTGPAA